MTCFAGIKALIMQAVLVNVHAIGSGYNCWIKSVPIIEQPDVPAWTVDH